MTVFLDRQLDFVLFAVGLTFLLVSVISLRLARSGNRVLSTGGLSWGYFSLFALFQVVVRWMSMGTLAYAAGQVYEYFRLLLLLVSYSCLLESCRPRLGILGEGWRVSGWLYALLLLASASGIVWGVSGADAAINCFFGLTACVLAGVALLGWGRQLPPVKTVLGLAGWGLVVFGGTVALLAVLRLGFSLGFLGHSGFSPVAFEVMAQCVQLLPVLAVFLGLWRLHYRFVVLETAVKIGRMFQTLMAVSVLALLLGSWLLVELVGSGAEREAQQKVCEQADVVALMLDRNSVSEVVARPMDTESTSYRHLLAQMTKVWLAEDELRGVYLMVPHDGKVVYSVSVETATRESLGGRTYDGDPPGVYEVLAEGVTRFSSVSYRSYGQLGTVLAPIIDERGRTVAVLRYDVDISQIERAVARTRLIPITLIMVLALIVAYFMMDRSHLREMRWHAERYQKSLVSLAEVDTTDLKLALETVARKVTDVTGTSGVSFWRTSGGGYSLECTHVFRQDDSSNMCVSLERQFCPLFFAALERERVIAASDARSDRRTAELTESYLEPLGIVSIVAVVMSRAEEGKGLMVVEQKGAIRKWAPEEVAFIGAAAQIATLAMETADRRAAEKAALESQKKMAQIIDFLPDAAFVIDRQGKVIYWNRAIEALTGVRAQDIVGKGDYEHAIPFRGERVPSLADYAMNAPEEIPTRYPGAVNRGGVWFADVYLPKLRGGLWLALAVGLLRNDEGEVVGAIETLRDITSVKEAEAALRAAKENADRMNRQLEQAMSHANRMAIEAALANEAKSAFLATMSHEIRTPMNGIIGMTGLLLDTQLTPEQRQYAETVRNSAEALLSIINDILDFSKIEAGKMELEKTTFNLLTVLEGVVDIVALKAQEKGLELGYVVAPEVPEWLEGDAGRLRQILTNLVGNAVKFTHKGEVAIRVSLRDRTGSKVKLYFEVKDTGIGIPEDKIGSLFRPFTQVDASTTRKYGGTGLGLSIAKSLAEAMGGEIGVHSVEGKGSTFWFTVVLGLGEKPLEERAMEGVVDIAGARVLVVDDNETNRQLLSRMLDIWGCVYETASSAAEGLEKMKRAAAEGKRFDVVLTDMVMPEMDGEGLVRAIRSEVLLRDTPVVLMTSLGHPSDPKSLREAGFDAYLVKPLKQYQVKEVLASVLGRRGQVAVPEVSKEPARPVGRLRILVAEDNVTSQKVAQALLAKMGHHSDAVANGLEAVRALETIPYDMVLMDIQMPEMDGIQATRIIRDPSSKVLNHNIPIIALTAYAMKGDAEKFLAAGMDDYVTKPVTPDALAAAIQRQASRLSKVTGVKEKESEAGTQVPTVFDREGIMKRFGGDVTLFKEIVAIFLEDAPSRLKALKEALQSGDATTVHREGHTLKGAAGNVGALELKEIAYKIETAGKNSDLKELSALIQMAEKALDDFRGAVTRSGL